MNTPIFADLTSTAIIVSAVFLVGLSKGGFGGVFGILGVPILTLIMPPLEAVAFLLPIYLVMDIISLWTWRGQWHKGLVWNILPMAILGICVGWITASIVSDKIVSFLVGSIALLFVFQRVVLKQDKSFKTSVVVKSWLGHFWGLIAGFTSFIAHAGGPPFQIYAMPLRLDPKVFTSSSVLIFSVLNFVKIGPYVALGRLNLSITWSALTMIPIAICATLLGALIVKKMNTEIFYPIMYGFLTLISLRLIVASLL